MVDAPGGRRKTIGKCQARPIPDGTIVSLRTGGGGGFGDPRERDAELVAQDVRAGYVSRERAATDYGVVLNPNSFEIDEPATLRRRFDESL
jgi:N-methylhydantoinase B